jgi:voltage-gated potassium channel Kch
MNLFREQIQWIKSRSYRDHVVIGGLGSKSCLLVKGFLAQGSKVIVIDKNPANIKLESCQQEGAVVLVGDFTDPELLRQAGVQRASMAIAVSGNDRANAEMAVRVNELCAERDGAPLKCIIHIVDSALWDLLQERQFSGQFFENVRLEMFNVYLHGARILVEDFVLRGVSGRFPTFPHHVLIVGMDKLGSNLVVESAREWFYQRDAPKARIRMTLIDRSAEEVHALINARYPGLSASVDITALNMNVNSPEFIRGEHLIDVDGVTNIDIALICLDEPSEALFTGLTLRRRLPEQTTPIIMRVPEESGMADLIRGRADQDGLVSIQPFGLLERTCTPELVFRGTHEAMARALHEEYYRLRKRYRTSRRTNVPYRSWERLPESEREANRREADQIGDLIEKVDCQVSILWDWTEKVFRFTSSEVEILSRMKHERWCGEMFKQGWRYSPGRQDLNAKLHPALLHWNDLPEPRKERNRIVIRQLPKFLARTGLKVRRRAPNNQTSG